MKKLNKKWGIKHVDIVEIKKPKLLRLLYEQFFFRSAKAMFEIGECYYYGKCGLKQDYYKAVEWYKKSSQSGYEIGSLALGKCYERGTGIRKDYKQAIRLYKKAAQQKCSGLMNSKPVSLFNFKNERTKAQKKRYEEIIEFYMELAESGDAISQSGDAISQYKLAEHFHNRFSFGNREERDIKEAAYWYRESAEQGNILAQYEMGNCCYYGWGMDKDYTEAYYWYHEAAEKGLQDAQEKLGEFYYNAIGVKKNYKEAAKWFRKATEQNITWIDHYKVVGDRHVCFHSRGDFDWFIVVIDEDGC